MKLGNFTGDTNFLYYLKRKILRMDKTIKQEKYKLKLNTLLFLFCFSGILDYVLPLCDGEKMSVTYGVN